MKRPTIFLSSTIYDFQDMRSALKYFFEEQGCRVLASDYNDFPKDERLHSYEACLKTIEQADIFVLLIGGRVGGWYDEQKKISITQKEYETAYELQKAGKLRILSFVRRDVWNHKEDLKSLERHLKENDQISKEAREYAVTYRSRFATDAATINGFIELVSRNAETSRAVSGDGGLPVGNWLHVFGTFGEVIDAIAPLILNGMDVTEAAGRKALQNQLLILLRGSVWKVSGTIFDLRTLMARYTQQYPVDKDNLTGTIRLDGTDFGVLFLAALSASAVRVSPEVLLTYAGGHLLLEYDPSESAYKETEVYLALNELIEEIRLFGMANGNLAKDLMPYMKASPSGPIHVKATHIFILFVTLHRLINIVELTKAIIHALDGKPFVAPSLMPRSPGPNMTVALEKERVTVDEVRKLAGI